MNFKAIIFDLDGTLLYSLEDIADCMNATLSKFSYKTYPLEDYKYFVGNGIKALVDKAVPKDISDDRRREVLDIYSSCILLHQYDKTRPYEGIVEVLLKLNELKIPIAVLSNKPHIATVSVIDHYFKNIEFSYIMGQKPGIPVKPDPAGAIEISKHLGFSLEDILYVGDSDVDMQMAKRAGMFPAGALWGFRTKDELLENGAKKVLENPKDILNIMDIN